MKTKNEWKMVIVCLNGEPLKYELDSSEKLKVRLRRSKKRSNLTAKYKPKKNDIPKKRTSGHNDSKKDLHKNNREFDFESFVIYSAAQRSLPNKAENNDLYHSQYHLSISNLVLFEYTDSSSNGQNSELLFDIGKDIKESTDFIYDYKYHEFDDIC